MSNSVRTSVCNPAIPAIFATLESRDFDITKSVKVVLFEAN